jgi:hypothetical protein
MGVKLRLVAAEVLDRDGVQVGFLRYRDDGVTAKRRGEPRGRAFGSVRAAVKWLGGERVVGLPAVVELIERRRD